VTDQISDEVRAAMRAAARRIAAEQQLAAAQQHACAFGLLYRADLASVAPQDNDGVFTITTLTTQEPT
jgi:hypothetical protein